jgi:hypothetical protein
VSKDVINALLRVRMRLGGKRMKRRLVIQTIDGTAIRAGNQNGARVDGAV